MLITVYAPMARAHQLKGCCKVDSSGSQMCTNPRALTLLPSKSEDKRSGKASDAYPTFSMRILYVQTGLATGVSMRSRGILLPMEAVVISTYTPCVVAELLHCSSRNCSDRTRNASKPCMHVHPSVR